MNIWEVLILFFSFQAVIFAILFSIKGGAARLANRIFAVFLLLFAYDLFYCVLYWTHFDADLYTLLRGTYYIPVSLYGGLFFLYVKSLTTYRPLTWKDSLHALPLLLVIYQFGGYIFLPAPEKFAIAEDGTFLDHLRLLPWGHTLLVLVMAVYAVVTFRSFIQRFKQDPDLGMWLKLVCSAFLVFSISHVVYSILFELIVIPPTYDYFIVIFMILFICLVTYFAFMYSHVFNGVSLESLIPFIKYEKTGLSDDFSLELKRKLLQIMKNDRPYLDPEVRLDTLADMLDISRHHASQIINQHFSMHFYDFINKYRIGEAEELLRDPKLSISITDVAYQTGFNNRISFYKAFKKYMGMTPSEYRDHSMASL